jgi:flagellar hook assembly protein FlgD
VFNGEGRVIRTLVDGAMAAGQHATHWDGRDATGQRLASGVYFYRLESAQGTITRKTTLLR